MGLGMRVVLGCAITWRVLTFGAYRGVPSCLRKKWVDVGEYDCVEVLNLRFLFQVQQRVWDGFLEKWWKAIATKFRVKTQNYCFEAKISCI